jgi:hypothetical protein
MSKWFVNTRSLSFGHITGVQRYTLELLQRSGSRFQRVQPVRALDGSKGHIWEQSILPQVVGDNWLWSPVNTGPLCVERQAVTVHDASTLEHPEWFERRFAMWYQFLLPRLIRHVRVVLTNSEYSRERLIHYVPEAESKIFAVPLVLMLNFSMSHMQQIMMCKNVCHYQIAIF